MHPALASFFVQDRVFISGPAESLFSLCVSEFDEVLVVVFDSHIFSSNKKETFLDLAVADVELVFMYKERNIRQLHDFLVLTLSHELPLMATFFAFCLCQTPVLGEIKEVVFRTGDLILRSCTIIIPFETALITDGCDFRDFEFHFLIKFIGSRLLEKLSIIIIC